jgi:pyruvate formate lyase activating enzyme
VNQSLTALLESGVAHEVRTTVHPDLADDETQVSLAEDLVRRGVKRYALQQFRRQGCTDQALCQARTRPPGKDTLARIGALFESFEWRAA